MTYHTVLKTSQDYIDALRQAREIGANITQSLALQNRSDSGGGDSSNSLMEVFPYRCVLTVLDSRLLSQWMVATPLDSRLLLVTQTVKGWRFSH